MTATPSSTAHRVVDSSGCFRRSDFSTFCAVAARMSSRQIMRAFIENTVWRSVQIAPFESWRNSTTSSCTTLRFRSSELGELHIACGHDCLQSDRMHNSAQDSYVPAHSENLVVSLCGLPQAVDSHAITGSPALSHTQIVIRLCAPNCQSTSANKNTSSPQGTVHDNPPFAMNFWYRLGYV